MSILTKMKDIVDKRSVLVAGEASTGKTHAIIEDILLATTKDATGKPKNGNHDNQAPLWISFTNLNGLERCPEWDIARPTSWDEFEKEILNPLVKRKFTHDIVVIDGLHILASWRVHKAAADRKKTITMQIDFKVMSNAIMNMIIQLKQRVNRLYVTIDIIPDAEDNPTLAINKGLYNKLISQFSEKWIAHAKFEGSKVVYGLNKSGSLISHFKPRTHTNKGH